MSRTVNVFPTTLGGDTIPPAGSSDGHVHRIAVIGCGPRGLQCLEAISRRLTDRQLANLEVTIFDNAPVPGAGRVYDPDQPDVLRMNYASQHIDFWKHPGASTTPHATSLIGWLKKHYPQYAITDSYIPRGVVGRYLNDCYGRVTDRLQSCRRLELVANQVIGIHHHFDRWSLSLQRAEPSEPQTGPTKAGPSQPSPPKTGPTETGPTETGPFDTVLLTTGHEGLRTSDALPDHPESAFVHPVTENLGPHVVSPNSTVLIRGFALTAIDAMLALSEGRGGEFVQRDGQWRYVDSPDQPKRIYVQSRSGRPGLAKPTEKVEPIDDHFWDTYRQQLNNKKSIHGHLRFHHDIWNVVCRSAADLLYQSGHDVTAGDVKDWFRGWSRYTMDRETVLRTLKDSYAVSTGQSPIDIPYAIARAWQNLYNEITDLVSYGGLAKGQFKIFQSSASEMERIAFGPPARSVLRIIALIESGLVVTCNQQEFESVDDPIDAVRDAVIAAPGQYRAGGPIWNLVDQDLVKRDPVTGGIMIDPMGRPIDAPEGIHIFGRSTEGWIVGNDTLSRTLHDHIERWAGEWSRRYNESTTDRLVVRGSMVEKVEVSIPK